MLTNQISQLTKEVASNAEAMTALSQVESRLIRYHDSAEQSALAVEAIQLRCQKLNEQLIQKNIQHQDKVNDELDINLFIRGNLNLWLYQWRSYKYQVHNQK